MRQNQKTNRMRRPRKSGGGGNQGNNLNRSYESNGPDVKVRGTPNHIAEKYQQLARDATSAGDRVAAENYYQHAEHYLRMIAAAQASQAEYQERRRLEDERRRMEEERRREEQERRWAEDERRRMERQQQRPHERQRDPTDGDDRNEARGDQGRDDRGRGYDEQPDERALRRDEMDDDAPRGRRTRRRRQPDGFENGHDHAPDDPRQEDRAPGEVRDERSREAGDADAGRPIEDQPPRASGEAGPEEAPKPRRRRRTKAEMEAAKAPDGQTIAHALPGAGIEANGAEGAGEAPRPRRRAPRRKVDDDAPEAAVEDA